jgi:hypothetical protein
VEGGMKGMVVDEPAVRGLERRFLWIPKLSDWA